jgi:crotonobetainyl-CoA:carnitine CoA-transferase CaiB-like acyl-CoA transferase
MRTGQTMARLGTFAVYRCLNGEWLAMTGAGPANAKAIYEIIGKPWMNEDPRFQGAERIKNFRQLTAEIEEWTSQRTADEAFAAFDARGVPAARVRWPQEAVSDELSLKRGDTVLLEHPKFGAVVPDAYVTGMPIHYSNAKVGFDRRAPAPGEHNQEIYGGFLGYSAEQISSLQSAGVI